MCVHAPTETSEDEVKDEFYNQFDGVWDNLHENDIQLVVVDLNAKCGRETHYETIIGKESLHAISNRNEFRLISFAASNSIVVRSTTFPRKNIYKTTWKSPDGNTLKQIYHVITKNRFRSCMNDIRSFSREHIDTDHFLLILKF